jgi:hypothetical protein
MPVNNLFFEGANARPSDERLDMFEAEYGDNGHDRWSHGREPGYEFILDGWDESQALEILSVKPGWLFGERFYQPFDTPDDDLDLEDFQYFRPKQSLVVDWCSIDEGPVA